MSCPPAPMPSITIGFRLAAAGVDGGGQPGGSGADDDDLVDLRHSRPRFAVSRSVQQNAPATTKIPPRIR